MGKITDVFKAVFSTTKTTASYLPIVTSDGTPNGKISVSNLANVLGIKYPADLVGQKFQSGDDLNDCYYGTYRSDASSLTKTLVNSPITDVGFVLWNLSAYGGTSARYIRQIAISYNHIYMRGKADTNSKWSDWHEFVIS